MRPRENYIPFMSAAFGLTLTILVVFQIYIFGEPARIQEQEAADRASTIGAGHALYAANCTACHGESGEGGTGPALNSRELLRMTSDEAFFNLIRTGVPGTIMPAWGQTFGGPLTDEQAAQLVAYIRAWEPTAPELIPVVAIPDPIRGARIYSRTCFICHGRDGQGTERAPALNDPARLNRLDDAWYRSTIAYGRPARGMPTWGTVLAPDQIYDLVALLAAWREGQTVVDDTPLAVYLNNALFAIREFDRVDAEFYLNAALATADDAQAMQIRPIIDLVQKNQLFVAQSQVAALLPPEEMGQALYINNCVSCHGADGTGGLGPNLHNNAYIQSQSDEDLAAFLLVGRRGTPMNGFEGILAEEDLRNLVSFLRSWQD